MKKLTLTILHKLPNRIRFQVSERIRDLKSFAHSVIIVKYDYDIILERIPY